MGTQKRAETKRQRRIQTDLYADERGSNFKWSFRTKRINSVVVLLCLSLCCLCVFALSSGSSRARKFVRSDRFASIPGTPVSPKAGWLPLLPSGPGGVHSALPHRTQPLTERCGHTISFVKAEREGFEPSRACTLRAFQARALGQAMRPLQAVPQV